MEGGAEVGTSHSRQSQTSRPTQLMIGGIKLEQKQRSRPKAPICISGKVAIRARELSHQQPKGVNQHGGCRVLALLRSGGRHRGWPSRSWTALRLPVRR
jgi:hypothetical protein